MPAPPRPRTLALTQAHLARVARPVPEVAAPSRYPPLSDDDFAALADRLVADLAGGPLWLFAFGSLIWKPAFEHVEQRRAIAHGWHRSFCIPSRPGAARPTNLA